MNAEPIATYTTPDQTHRLRFQYELFADTIVTRATGRNETGEATYPLRYFTEEERVSTRREPFKLIGHRKDATALVFLVGLIGGAIFGRDASLTPLLIFLGACVVVFVLARYSNHDGREWRWVEFYYARDGAYWNAVTVVGHDGNHEEQERFLTAFRSQIQKVRAEKSS
jgi:hypothetical protein